MLESLAQNIIARAQAAAKQLDVSACISVVDEWGSVLWFSSHG